MKNTYVVTDPKGITLGGRKYEEGDTLTLSTGPILRALLHFGQVKPGKAAKGKAEDAGQGEEKEPASESAKTSNQPKKTAKAK